MKQELVDIKLHGILGEVVGASWKLAVGTVSEAVRAIEVVSGNKLYKALYDNDKKGIKYRVLINERDFLCDDSVDFEKPETLINSELVMKVPNLKTIDIVPVIEGAEDIGAIIAGVVLIIIGIVLIATGYGAPFGVPLIMAGIGLVAAGVINLLSPQPKFEDFREFGGGKASYLFNGPQNTTREGGPVPVGYGRLIVGSQVISASYEVNDVNAAELVLTQ